MAAPVSVVEAARAVGISPSQVRRDVQRGCDGIVRPGEPGRSKGALLDLNAYTAWRSGRRHDDKRVLEIVADVLARVVRELEQTRALRRHTEFVAIAVYVRMVQALTRRDVDELPETLRAACAILTESPAPHVEEPAPP